MNEIDNYLQSLYFDIAKPGALAGPKKLYDIVKKDGKYQISEKKIRQWINDRDEYSLQRDVKRKFPRRKIITSGPDIQWGIDLASTQNIAKYNDDTKFLLFAVDVFSRYLHIQPLRSKSSKDVVEAFDQIIQKGTKPFIVYSDAGREFQNARFKNYLNSKNIKFFTTKNQETKVAITERTIRTVRNMMFRMFRHHRSYRFVESLQSIVSNYNATPHSSLPNGLSPNQITTSNMAEVWDKIFNKPDVPQMTFNRYNFKVGDIVRLSYSKHTFQRDYQQKWTGELFKISKRNLIQNIQIYEVEDYMNVPVQGTFYSNELMRVRKSKDSMWIIDKIIKSRRIAGKKQYLVKFEDWPSKFNSWIDATSIKNIQKQ